MYSEDCSFDNKDPQGDLAGKSSVGRRIADKSLKMVGPPHSAASIDEKLAQLATMTARLFNAEICLLLLLESGEPPENRFKLYSGYRPLPATVYAQWVKKAEAIARKAVAAGGPLVEEYSVACHPGAMNREEAGPRECMIASHICIEGRTIGVVNVASEKNSRLFNAENMQLLGVVSWFVGQSLQVVQLESLLISQFALMAVAQEAQYTLGNALAVASQRPEQLAKMLAKSFYREMVKVGFNSAQIINAAAEIVSQLSDNLQKHRKRNRRA